MAVDIRFLGHAAFELKSGDTTVLVDPFLTGNPKAAVEADEVEPDPHPAHPRPPGPLRRHGRDRQAHRRHGRGDRRARRRDRRGGRRERLRPQPRRHGQVRLGLGQARARPGTPRRRPRAPSTRPAGLLIHIGGKLVYHLGDTALFSDLQLISRRGDQVDVALVPIGGHYTMDRHDAVTAVEFVDPTTVIPVPLRHVPADRDRRRGVQGRRRVPDGAPRSSSWRRARRTRA